VRFGGFGLDEDGIDGFLGLGRRAGRDDEGHRNDEVTYDDLQLGKFRPGSKGQPTRLGAPDARSNRHGTDSYP
jgi:hypothetical protein